MIIICDPQIQQCGGNSQERPSIKTSYKQSISTCLPQNPPSSLTSKETSKTENSLDPSLPSCEGEETFLQREMSLSSPDQARESYAPYLTLRSWLAMRSVGNSQGIVEKAVWRSPLCGVCLKQTTQGNHIPLWLTVIIIIIQSAECGGEISYQLV